MIRSALGLQTGTVIKDVELDNITEMLAMITPSVEHTKGLQDGRSSRSPDFVQG